MTTPVGYSNEEQDDLLLLHESYPTLSRGELLEAKENLDRYFDLAVRIFLRLEQERGSATVDGSADNSYDPDIKVDSL